MDFTDCQLLSRCVKCNGHEILTINNEEAKKQLNWDETNEFSKVKEYFQCTQCKQIYWEGSTWRKAKKRFESLSLNSENENNNNKN